MVEELDYPILSVSPEEQIPVLFRRHPERAWTIAELAAQCGLSESYLALRCRKRFGKAPGALLTEIRMTLARRLLRESDYQVKVIAAACGYPHPDSFCRALKKRVWSDSVGFSHSQSGCLKDTGLFEYFQNGSRLEYHQPAEKYQSNAEFALFPPCLIEKGSFRKYIICHFNSGLPD